MLDLMDAAGLGDKNMDRTVRITTFLVKFPFATVVLRFCWSCYDLLKLMINIVP
jgi:hypothetical protein